MISFTNETFNTLPLARLNELEIATGNLAEIGALFDQLPTTRVVGFEWLLGQNQKEVDFLLCYRTGDAAIRQALAAGALPPTAQWLQEGLQTFFERAPEQNPVWFEFDLTKRLPEPGLFISVQPGSARDMIAAVSNKLGLGRITETNLSLLDKISTPADLFQVGWLPHRDPETLRICLNGLTLESLPHFLTEAGWEGNWAAVEKTAAPITAVVDHIGVGIDIKNGQISPRLGIEYGFNGPKVAGTMRRWPELLSLLCESGDCSPAERYHLLNWIGPMTIEGGDSLFSADAMSIFNPAITPSIECGLHHIKTLHQGEKHLVKAYFGYAIYLRPQIG